MEIILTGTATPCKTLDEVLANEIGRGEASNGVMIEITKPGTYPGVTAHVVADGQILTTNTLPTEREFRDDMTFGPYSFDSL